MAYINGNKILLVNAEIVEGDTDEAYEAGKLAILDESKYMHPTISGSIITANDVSPITHEMGVTIKRNNLFDYDSVGFKNSDLACKPITIVKENNSFQFTNTDTGVACYAYTENISELGLMPNTTYTSKVIATLLDNGSSNIGQSGSMNLSLILQTNTSYDSSQEDKLYIVKGNNYYTPGTYELITTFTTPSDMTDYKYIVTRLANNTTIIFKDLQIELGATATAYTPYVPDLTAVKVSRCGKNLFDKSIPFEDYTPIGNGYNLLSIYVGSGSSVTVSLKQKHNIGLGGYFYCVAFKSDVAGASQKWMYHNSNASLCNKSVTMISEDSHISLIMTSEAYNSFKDEIMVEIGSTATDYEPYKEYVEYTPNADGTVEGLISISPNITLLTDTDGVSINCQYYRDIDLYIDNLITDIALTGGE